MSDKHIIDTDHMGLIECPVKENKTGWTWESDGYEGRTPDNCPVCGADGVEWFRLDYDLTPVFYAPSKTVSDAAEILRRLYEHDHVPSKGEIAKALGMEPSPFDTRREYQFRPGNGSWYVPLTVSKNKGTPLLLFASGGGSVATLDKTLLRQLRDDIDDHLRTTEGGS